MNELSLQLLQQWDHAVSGIWAIGIGICSIVGFFACWGWTKHISSLGFLLLGIILIYPLSFMVFLHDLLKFDWFSY